jgi:SH3 domain protein
LFPARVILLTLLTMAGTADALDYVSVGERAVILYDAPSLKARKVFVVSRYTPLEQVVGLDNWVKVRDSSGALNWVEKRALTSKRYVVVTAAQAALHLAPDSNAAVILQVRQQVALEWLESTGSGWVRVRHRDGLMGYIRTSDVWGV